MAEDQTVGTLGLAYDSQGAGEPVLFIHGALIAHSWGPMLEAPALSGRYQFLTYCRRGYCGSSRPPTMLTIEQHAADARALLRKLEVGRAHVVGHSFGGAVALQLALDSPETVASLALFEPALVAGASGAAYLDAIARVEHQYRGGDHEAALDTFLKPRFGEHYRQMLARSLPAAVDEALAHADVAFTLDLPSLALWHFTAEEAAHVSQPSLLVLGSESEALWDRFGETYRLMLNWLPQAEGIVLPGATHALQMENPIGAAETLADFLGRHSLAHRDAGPSV